MPLVHSAERTPIHVANNKSSNSSIVTIQRAPSSSRSQSHYQPVPSSLVADPPVANSANLQRRPSIDGLGNLNRWSRSTSSSRDRRLSFSGGSESPKRLQKSCPDILRPFESTTNSILPPIRTLPSLQTSVNDISSPLASSPSTAGLLSAAVRSTVPDYFAAWDATPRDFSQKRTPSRSRSASNRFSPSLASGPSHGAKPSEEDEAPKSRGHSRNRSQPGKGSSGSSRNSKQPSQKAMLSKALQKANTAVLLDNAQNFEGAMQAYSEACALLQQVMLRSSGDEDRRKLEAIVCTCR
jgi:hypothetical protein